MESPFQTGTDEKTIQREILLGFWKVHILHHASEGPLIGQWMLNELRQHGYDVSPGTLYPILHRMERFGWLRTEIGPAGDTLARRSYSTTPKGLEVLDTVRLQLNALVCEVEGNRSPKNPAFPFRPKNGS